MYTLQELQTLYKQGKNVAKLMRDERGITHNTDEIIEASYELQTGTYSAAMSDPAFAEHKMAYAGEIAKTIQSLCNPTSVLEAGVGEATTLSGVLARLDPAVNGFGFDLSWSRVAYARRWLERCGHTDVVLCTGNLFDIPFVDNSIDVVYTSHSIEPNGGGEERILQELYRVARQYLILFEPAYELGSEEARQRMDAHGYCRNLTGTAQALGHGVLRHELFPHIANPLNPTAVTVIAKNAVVSEAVTDVFACPRYKTPLRHLGDMLYSREALAVYPVVCGIPCLRVENGILASKYEEIATGCE